MPLAGHKRKRSPSENILQTPQPKHPYLSGNFAPIHQTLPLTPCTYTGTIPLELADGEYVRNGSNPVSNDDLGRDAHWFDGDGMLSGVSFRRDERSGTITPEFVNQYILTDLYLSTISSPRLRRPILPSIATLVNPIAGFLYVTFKILRTLLLVILSHLPGSKQKVKKITVANTNVVYHDGRAMALCESGPPIRVQLPGLETVGWYNGSSAEGEPSPAPDNDSSAKVFGEGSGLIKFMREWTTAHPKVDPKTQEMLMFHSSFAPPYVQYSIVPKQEQAHHFPQGQSKLLNAPVPGVQGAKMMHDFGVSCQNTVIMDLPLSLDPVNQLKGLPPVSYDSTKPSRFGVFPRRHPEETKWFETDSCCIFHTANTWDELGGSGQVASVNMLACRLTSATLIFAAGNIAPPPLPSRQPPVKARGRMSFFSKYDYDTEETIFERAPLLESPIVEKEVFITADGVMEAQSNRALYNEEQCRLYYYNFNILTGAIDHQWALSAIPFEFPSVRPELEMQEARFIYGCSTTTTSFGSALGKATKIDALVKVDSVALIERGRQNPPRSVTGVVDRRTMAQVLESENPNDPISVFCMPNGWFAQEPRFVPASSNASEDDGYLLFYAFDEGQLNSFGDVHPDSGPQRAKSELWIVDARSMKDVIARVQLPQRVPYGLHGSWFSAEQIREQRPVDSIRSTSEALSKKDEGLWMSIRDRVERILG
jgi:carotenoid cleavage dioxygenase-like enzyme